jgi:acetyl esterase/lipase
MLKMNVFSKKKKQEAPVVIFVHGGYWNAVRRR